MSELNLEEFYTNRIEGICLLKDSIYYKIIKEMSENIDAPIDALSTFPDYAKHCYKLWGEDSAFALTRLTHCKETYIVGKQKIIGAILYYEVGDRKYILDGHHKASLSLVLKLTCGLVNESAEEYKWICRVKDTSPKNLFKLADNIYPGKNLLYHNVDLDIFKSWYTMRKGDSRLPLVQEAVKDCIRILDLGCHTGYFSFNLYNPDRFIVGVDSDKNAIEFANHLSVVYDKPVYFINQNIEAFYNSRASITKHFDVCLCMSVLHHVYGISPDKFYETLTYLGEMSDKLIIDIAQLDDNSIYPTGFKNVLTTEHFIASVWKYGKFTTHKILGKDTRFNRDLYMFEK